MRIFKNLFIFIVICLTSVTMTGCSNNTVDMEPTVKVPVSMNKVSVKVNWPENKLMNGAPPAGVTDIQILMLNKNFTDKLFGAEFYEYLEYIYSEEYMMYTAPLKSSSIPDYSELTNINPDSVLMFEYNVEVGSDYRDGVTIDGIEEGDYLVLLYAKSSFGTIDMYTYKPVSVIPGQISEVLITQSCWYYPPVSGTVTYTNGIWNHYSTTDTLDVTGSTFTTVSVDEQIDSTLHLSFYFDYSGTETLSGNISPLALGSFPSLTGSSVSISNTSGTSYEATCQISGLDMDVSGTSTYSYLCTFAVNDTTNTNTVQFYLNITGTGTAATATVSTVKVSNITDWENTDGLIKYQIDSGSPITTGYGASIDLEVLDGSSTIHGSIEVMYNDPDTDISFSSLTYAAGGTDYIIYKAEDTGKTDVSADNFPSGDFVTDTGKSGVSIHYYFDNVGGEYGSYILEITPDKGGEVTTDYYHLFIEQGLYLDPSTTPSLNDGSMVTTNVYNMQPIDGSTGNIQAYKEPHDGTTNFNGYSKFYAKAILSTSTPYACILNLAIPYPDPTVVGLKSLTEADIDYIGIGTFTGNDTLDAIQIIGNGFEFSTNLLDTYFYDHTTSLLYQSGGYNLKLQLNDLTYAGIEALSLPDGDSNGFPDVWYAIHLRNNDTTNSSYGKKYIIFGKIEFQPIS